MADMASCSVADLAADMADMEQLLAKATRPKVRAMISEYLGQLRDEYIHRSGADRREPASRPAPSVAAYGEAPKAMPTAASPAPAPAAPSKPAPAPAGSSKPPPAAAPAAPSTSTSANAPPPAPPPPAPVKLPAAATQDGQPAITYTTIPSFGWDQDSYGTEPNHVYVYITSGLDGVGEVKDRVTCDFTSSSFDLRVLDFGGKNLRLRKDNLDKEIVPEDSKVIVKKNRITIKMRKVKGQYGFDNWMELTAKKPKLDTKDPSAGLMDMMKDLYDNGDDQMKKTLGEAMLKSRQNPNGGMDDIHRPPL